MKAVVRRQDGLAVDTVEDPVPGRRQVLVRTLACGICGSDLHMHHHCDSILPQWKRALPASVFFDPQQDVVFGHEFCAEVLDYGPGARGRIKPGTRVCALPTVITPEGVVSVGYDNRYPGGYGERMVLQESTLVEVPGDLPAELAALTEPLSVGVHAVNMANLGGEEAALVLGCGPIGLATIIALKGRGIGPVVAADFSPARRALAERVGADVVVDPAVKSPYASWYELAAPAGYDPDSVAAFLAGLGGSGPQPKPCVIFECVGVPGVMNQIITDAPRKARIVVVGVCMQPDTIEPIFAYAKELSIQFSYGYSFPEFSSTLHRLADGTLQASELITGTIPMEAVPSAFEQLSKADGHAKIIVKFP